MRERDFQEMVVELCGWYGLLVYHTHDSRRSQAGFPDLVIVGNTVLMVELKSATGKVTARQRQWLDRLAGAGIETHLWRPDDWPEAQETLRRVSGK